jgi:3-mercaptopyruvate sulfurtransferase SseA
VAASLIADRGADDVRSVLGGMSVWKQAQHPTETEEEEQR